MRVNKILLLLFFLPLFCLAQDKGKVPLRTILDEITKQHDAKFSLIEEEIIVYRLVPPEKSLSLQQKLNYIEQRTRLTFEQVSGNYYTIYNDVRMDKPLCAYLIDEQTGLGIENAEILIPEKSISVTSDANGYFELPLLAPNTIHIKHLGFKEKSIDPSELYIPDCPALYLQPVVYELEEVAARQYLAVGITKQQSGEIVVKPRKFGILPGLTEADVLQTMQQLPGVISVDETVSNINVRGGTHDQNLFLWNGIRMFQTSHFYGLLSAFNPLQATSITIYKNGSPAFYGESVSSLVDISTHIKIPDSTYTTVAADLINVGFLTIVKLSDNDRLQLSGRRTYSDVWASPAFEQYQDRVFQNTTITDVVQDQQVPVTTEEDFYFYDFSFSYQRQLNDRHELLADGIGMQNDLNIFQRTDTAQRNGTLNQKNFGGGLLLKSQWNEKHHSEIQGYASWYSLDAVNEAIENEQVTHQENAIFDKGIRAKYSYAYSERLTLGAGYHLNEVSVRNLDEVNDPQFSNSRKDVSVSHALIGDFRYISASGSTHINGGIRANHFEKYSQFLAEPRLSVTQQLTQTFTLEVLGEMKSQTVSQVIDQQQDFLGIEKRRWVLADDAAVPIQKSAQVSLGLSYSNNGWLASAEGFYKRISGISSDSQGFQNQFEFLNSTGRYTVIGAELLIQKSFGRFYSWMSYSYNTNEYHFDGFVPPSFRNNFSISHAFSCAGMYDWDRLRLALGAKWRTGMPVTQPTGFTIDPDSPATSEIVYAEPNSTLLRDNLQVNFSASKTWNLTGKTLLTASCSVLNILDRKNIVNRRYRINTGTNSVESVNTYGLGLTPNVGLKLVF